MGDAADRERDDGAWIRVVTPEMEKSGWIGDISRGLV